MSEGDVAVQPDAPSSESLDLKGVEPQTNAEGAESAEQPTPEVRRIKVNGEEVEVTLQELEKGYGTMRAAQERFQEAARLRKEAEELKAQYAQNPFLSDDPQARRKAAEEFLAAELRKEMMSPEQRELEELKSYKQQQEELRKQQEEQQKQRQQQEMISQARQQLETDIVAALKESGLPTNANTMQRAAAYMYNAGNAGYQVKAADVMGLVKEDYINDIKHFTKDGDINSVKSMLGDEFIKKIHKADLDALKASQNRPTTTASAIQGQPSQRTKSKGITRDQLRQMISEKTGVEW